MADEIRYSWEMTLTNGELSDTFSTGSLTEDQTTARLARNVQVIGTSEVAIVLGSVVTPGRAFFKNIDDSDSIVEIGHTLRLIGCRS